MSTEKRFVPTWTFTSATHGAPAYRFEARVFEISDALMWFHADRQIVKGLGRDDYAIHEVVPDHREPQRYDRFDLPPRSPDIRECMFSKSLFNAHEANIKKLGWEIRVAA